VPNTSSSSSRSDPRVILDGPGIARIIDRIAHQILEKTEGGTNTVLLGIPTRGVYFARRLGRRLASFSQQPIAVGTLDITLYRDDLHRRDPRPLQSTEVPNGGIDDKRVILVDDVLFSGRTIRAGLDALSDVGRPSAVQLAVLVDRGHREVPIRADYIGKNLPTSRNETVKVFFSEIDKSDGVILT
jgi:pyrimidine operon attenuation protein / uracil phosphoribosyltransferase